MNYNHEKVRFGPDELKRLGILQCPRSGCLKFLTSLTRHNRTCRSDGECDGGKNDDTKDSAAMDTGPRETLSPIGEPQPDKDGLKDTTQHENQNSLKAQVTQENQETSLLTIPESKTKSKCPLCDRNFEKRDFLASHLEHVHDGKYSPEMFKDIGLILCKKCGRLRDNGYPHEEKCEGFGGEVDPSPGGCYFCGKLYHQWEDV